MSIEQKTYSANTKTSSSRGRSAIPLKFYSKIGVTLVELLLFVAIIAIAAAVGFPTVWQDTGKRADMKTAQGLASDLEYVRSMALMDMPGFANAIFDKRESRYDVATRTKELTGNYVFNKNASFLFNSDGTLTTRSYVKIKRGPTGPVVATIESSSSGFITWSLE